MCGWHDLGKPKGAATKRVAKLKATGAWDSLKALLFHEWSNTRAYLHALGRFKDAEMLDMCHPGCPEELRDEAIGEDVFMRTKPSPTPSQTTSHAAGGEA